MTQKPHNGKKTQKAKEGPKSGMIQITKRQKDQKGPRRPKISLKMIQLTKRPEMTNGQNKPNSPTKVVKNCLKGPMLLQSSQDCLRWPKRAQILASQYMAENVLASFSNTLYD